MFFLQFTRITQDIKKNFKVQIEKSITKHLFLRVLGHPFHVLKMILEMFLLGEFFYFCNCPVFQTYKQKHKSAYRLQYRKHLYSLKSNTKRFFLKVLRQFLRIVKVILLVVLLGEFFKVLKLPFFSLIKKSRKQFTSGIASTCILSNQMPNVVFEGNRTTFANCEGDSPSDFVGRVF